MTDVSTPQPSDVRRLGTPSATALTTMAAVFEDLQTVLRCCERLTAYLQVGPERSDDLTLEALWTTALLSYMRCFGAGKHGLSETDVEATGLPGDLVGWHHTLEQLRAHYADPAVNPREIFSVGAARDASGAAAGVAITSVRQPRIDDLTVRQTGALAFELSRIVDERIAEQQKRVFTTVKSMTKRELERLPVLEIAEPAAEPTAATVPPARQEPDPES